MKTIKPLRVGVLTGVFESRREQHFVVTVLAGFTLVDEPSLVPEAALWLSITKELGANVPLDVCRPKTNGEVLLSGKAFPAGGSGTVCPIRFKLGKIDKRLAVFGDRMWKFGVPTTPAPFTEMPITWSRSFGGKGFAKNPVGRGFAPEKTEDGAEVHYLPNVENPARLIKAPGDRPEPVTFGPVDLTQPERWANSGTYDKKWMDTEAPGLPSDFDWNFFNVAPPDQRLEGFFSGGETIEIENMHPEQRRIVSKVPEIIGRAFINKKTAQGEEWTEVPLRMETIHLLPGALLGVVLFRGVVKIVEDDAKDVLHLLAALDAKDQKRSSDYYKEVWTRRLDKEKGHLHALRDRELLPIGASYAAFRADEVGLPGTTTERIVSKNLRAGFEARLAEADKNLDHFPDSKKNAKVPKKLPPEEPLPDVDDMAEHVETMEKEMEKAREVVKKQREEALANLRARCEAAGLNYDEQMKKAQAEAAGPPKFSADAQLTEYRGLAARYRAAGTPSETLEKHLADPEFEKKLRFTENKLREMYRRFGHHYPPASPLVGDRADKMREVVLDARASGQSLEGRDLTGAVLDGLDLSGLNLEGAMLEAASLRGAVLRKTRLAGATLVRADLTNADFEGAQLVGTNLGAATFAGAKFTKANLAGATLDKSDLNSSDFTGADMTDASLLEATFGAVILRGVKIVGARFLDAKLMNVDFSEADLSKVTFLECDLTGANLSGSKLVSAAFLHCIGTGANFFGAALDNARFVQECDFSNATFRKATFVEANLRGTVLVEADLTETLFDRGDLSECDLRRAKLDRMRARESRWVRTNLEKATLRGADLMLALMHKAKVAGTDFRGASLFRADLARMKGDDKTSFDSANVTQVRFVREGGA